MIFRVLPENHEEAENQVARQENRSMAQSILSFGKSKARLIADTVVSKGRKERPTFNIQHRALNREREHPSTLDVRC